MTRLRLIFLTLLFLAPFVVLMGLGGYYLWKADALWVWWPLLACMGLAYFLAWRWTRRRGMLPPTEIPAPEYWTDRDKLAWEKVDAKAKSFEKVTLDQISTPQHYADLAVDLATEVGTIYNPGRSFRPSHAARGARVRRACRGRPQRHGAEVRPRCAPHPPEGHQAGPEGLRLVQDRPERLLGRRCALRPDRFGSPLPRIAAGARRPDEPHPGQPHPLVPHRVHPPARPLPHRTQQRPAQGRREALSRDPRPAPGAARDSTHGASRSLLRRSASNRPRRQSPSPSPSSDR